MIYYELCTSIFHAAGGFMDKDVPKIKFLNLGKLLTFSIIWIGLIIKLFFFDWDIYFISNFLPDFYWLINYRAVIIIFLLAISSKMKISMFLLNSLLFAFFPLVLLFGIIPAKIFKTNKWCGLIAFISSLILVFRNFRFKTIVFIAYILAFFTIQFSSQLTLIIIATITLAVCFIVFLISLFKTALGKQNLHQTFVKIANNHIERKENSTSQLQLLSESDLENINIQKMVEGEVLLNRILLFSANKVKDYKEKNFFIMQEITLFIMVSLTLVFTFSTINFGLYRIEPSYFLSDFPSFLDFIIYTANISNTTIVANHEFTKTLVIIYHGMMALFVGLFATMFIKNIKNAQIRELEIIISQLEKVADDTEKKLCINSPYNNIDDIIEALVKLESASIGFICMITKSLS